MGKRKVKKRGRSLHVEACKSSKQLWDRKGGAERGGGGRPAASSHTHHLLQWLGASAKANFNLQASASSTLTSSLPQCIVGRFCKRIIRPWREREQIFRRKTKQKETEQQKGNQIGEFRGKKTRKGEMNLQLINIKEGRGGGNERKFRMTLQAVAAAFLLCRVKQKWTQLVSVSGGKSHRFFFM